MFAITGQTAAKLIMDRADASIDHMGMVSFQGELPTLKEVEVGKNYLDPDELYRLHLLCEQFLLFAETVALRGKALTMDELKLRLDKLLDANDYPIFGEYREFVANQAREHAKRELATYKARVQIQGVPSKGLIESNKDRFLKALSKAASPVEEPNEKGT